MPDASVAGPNLLSWQPIIRSHLELEACKVSYYCLKSDYNQAKRSNEMVGSRSDPSYICNNN